MNGIATLATNTNIMQMTGSQSNTIVEQIDN